MAEAVGASTTLEELQEVEFDKILQSEIGAINARRRALGREPLSSDIGTVHRPKVIDAVGLALSGGGVRSAAFSLGVLQALNHNDVLNRIDYLSTVSGGGYIGTSLTATMTESKGKFVFGSQPSKVVKDKPLVSEITDTKAVGHLRNYSNYLIPAGARDVVTGLAIIVRGLVANFGIVFPIVLLLATLTILSNPNRSALTRTDFFSHQINHLPPHFGLTVAAALIGLVFFLLWALFCSLPHTDNSEFRGRMPAIGAFVLVIIAATFFGELQPFVINGMFEIADAAKQAQGGTWGLITGAIQTLTAIVTPIAAVVMFFRQQLADVLKAQHATSKLSTRVLAASGKVVFWIAGAALPLLIWVGYLYLCFWGIINDQPAVAHRACDPGKISGKVQIDARGLNYQGNIRGNVQIGLQNEDSCAKEQAAAAGAVAVSKGERKPVEPISIDLCRRQVDAKGHFVGKDGLLIDKDAVNLEGGHTPRWLLTTAECFSNWVDVKDVVATGDTESFMGRLINRPLTYLYFIFGLALFLLSLILAPNANSLHRLYRDRLSKAFLFNPQEHAKTATVIDQGRDFAPLDRMRVSKISSAYAPYHLINAALNIQGSDYANRRGRNADFFLFSPLHIGSLATNYAPMENFEQAARDLDLATAMAISGAAASSNMGANSIRPLTPTLALLNVRLGYWLKNPRFVPGKDGKRRPGRKRRLYSYLWAEILGRLYEDGSRIYLTDGGHIENLGIYELLKRRCKLIIVADAEADFSMRFPSFITLQRYARIDLGIRIEMPWDAIRKTTCDWMGLYTTGTTQKPDPSEGPHAAIGVIDYGGGQKGYLLYIKSSLTGDENDYILDYARRYQRFPHETTGDQFFSEEQFEVYRALGFHAVHGVISERDVAELCVAGKPKQLNLKTAGNDTIDAVRTALKG